MLFNSIDFAIFLPIVFVLYWFVVNRSLKLQNMMLLAASYFFYACWDWRFLFLLIFSTLLDYYTGIKIHDAENKKRKRFWLLLSVCINLGFLGVFKYYDFFITSFADGLAELGVKMNYSTLNIILPVGISFYTFHGLSYVLDIFYGRIKPERNFVDYSVFVSFFPLLVAGPIERATHLLPQIIKKREFNYSKAVDGLRQILWGLFKKIVIADNCAVYVDLIFSNSSEYSGATLLLGTLFFSFQVYGDFSGYSDIALGTARLFGIELLRNFSFPYFSRDLAEFWRRWHISLTTWFRDYLYIPLGGSKGGTWMKLRNMFIIFVVSGFWHGAAWTYIVWGAVNAVFMVPLLLSNSNRTNLETVAQGKYLPTLKEFFQMAMTFGLLQITFMVFRSNSMGQAVVYVADTFAGLLDKSSYSQAWGILYYTVGLTLPVTIIVFMLIEWFGREQKYGIECFGFNWPKSFRWAFYYCVIIAIIVLGGKEQQFVYFQF